MRAGKSFVLAAIVLGCAALASPAGAQKDKDHGNQGKDHGNGRPAETRPLDARPLDTRPADNRGPTAQQHSAPAAAPAPAGNFVIVDRDRSTVSTYYREEFARGNCPPGLAKKDNGCLPPGQARKVWVVGQPLPPNVSYYPLPQPLYTRLTPPPPGYEYVRVDNDVLLMQSSSRSIVNLIANLF